MAKKGLVVALVLAVVGGLAWWLISATGEPVKVIRAHLEAINQGDYPRAYGYFSAEMKKQMTPEQFREFLEKYADVMKTRDSTFPSREIRNNVATIQGTFTGQTGRVVDVRCTLVKEGDRWAISAIRWNE